MPKSYGLTFPQKIPSTRFIGFTKVTNENRKELIVLGRVLWIIEKNPIGTGYIINGCFPVRPKMEAKRTLSVSGDPHVGLKEYQVFIPFEEKLEDYKDRLNSVINKGISDGTLYVKNSEKLVKYKLL